MRSSQAVKMERMYVLANLDLVSYPLHTAEGLSWVKSAKYRTQCLVTKYQMHKISWKLKQ